jgi:UDP-3-O-[3-hydroxymyristoyl] N-acetylglucosamine deacetylase / 3-hydroxyacyl-[acyl-carrier-protein] dehydratase
LAIKQKTITNSVTIEGVGLHRGKPVVMTFHPAEVDHGIAFKINIDDMKSEMVKVCSKNIFDKQLRTALTSGGIIIETVEHVLSAVNGLGIKNLLIEMDEIEPPACDGCSLFFCEKLIEAGIIDQEKDCDVFVVKEPISVYEDEGTSITILPAKSGMTISYSLAGEELPNQFVTYAHSTENYLKSVAISRTFCRKFEIEVLKSTAEVGEGANQDNTLIVDLETINSEQKIDNELAYHKILDLIGDLSFFGRGIQGHIICHKSGHSCNHKIVKELISKSDNKIMDINEIKKILPHAYPFLLVDKIIHYEENKSVIGLKNVTYNESFFQGHFPYQPIMPGVLLIEALAQTGAVFVYKKGLKNNQLVLFAGADKVKFRRQVIPGDQVILEVIAKNLKASVGIVKAVARVENQVACEAELKFMTVEK